MPLFNRKNRKTVNNKRKSKKEGGRKSDLSLAVRELQYTTATKPTPGVYDIPKIILAPINTYTVKNNYFTANLVTSAAVSTFGSVVIALNQLTKQTSYAAVFDAYRFKQVTVRFVPLTPPSAGNSPLLTVVDYDDSTALTTTSQLRAYDNLYEVPFGSYCERTFAPKYAVGTYSGAVFTSFSQNDGWCDIASNTIQWYGLKYGIDTTTLAQTAWSIEVDVIVQFRSIR